MSISSILLVVHGCASVFLAVFGFHRLRMALAYRRIGNRPLPQTAFLTPRVTVQIPLYNERFVAERVVRAVAALDYPPEALDIQVLDDSTDDTVALVRDIVRELAANGVDIVHIRRAHRKGFKAGALAHGLRTAKGEFIAIFDADFIPEPDFLRRILPEFADARTGMVQARWGHLNRDASWLTRAQALQLDAHFRIEHGVRADQGVFFNFNGTAGIWRRRAIDDAGGWAADTLTEDLDLSYRAQLQGWKFTYRDDVVVPAEVPQQMSAYRTQQQRWAQGGTETARKLTGTILRARLPLRTTLAAMEHLFVHLSYPLLVLVTMAGLALTYGAGTAVAGWVVAIDGLLLGFALASLSWFYATALWARNEPRPWRHLPLVLSVMVLGAGIAIGQTAAVVRGALRIRSTFARTPKTLDGGLTQGAAYQTHRVGWAARDLAIGILLSIAAAGLTIDNRLPPSGLVLLLSIGLLAVGSVGLVQHYRVMRRIDDIVPRSPRFERDP